ncbi:hypothetical protein [Pseudoduganella aquatica]|uniref:Uncharacterized protein n=1 Tax=Pseudoduganella aquatica TaxID=2660641 RepID=A0A7X4HGY0_9BURK|nr:hypothetical protein [Pseudoduganella aquatica]MYN10297.1 hypothetical protein [Pseudoduganella aquatica]
MSARATTGAAPAATSQLLTELQHADAIIKSMLNAMTTEQKTKVHAQLDAAGVSGEGMTRANERGATITAALAVHAETSAEPGAVDVKGMCAQAEIIEMQAAHIRILLLALCERLDGMQGLPQAAVQAVNAASCFATCALRNASLIEDEAVGIYLEGGAA